MELDSPEAEPTQPQDIIEFAEYFQQWGQKEIATNDIHVSQLVNQSHLSDLKLYVADFPSSMNYDLATCARKHYGTECVDFSYHGLGAQLYSFNNVSIRNSWMFALEVIVHERMKASVYRYYHDNTHPTF